jgi:general secretion pathway protein K
MDYLGLEPPYRAANRALTTVDGLARVKGFDAETLARLRPFVTALPQATQVNVNTAPADEMAAVLSVSDEQGQAIVQYRAGHGKFADVEALRKVPGLETVKLNPEAIKFQ